MEKEWVWLEAPAMVIGLGGGGAESVRRRMMSNIATSHRQGGRRAAPSHCLLCGLQNPYATPGPPGNNGSSTRAHLPKYRGKGRLHTAGLPVLLLP